MPTGQYTRTDAHAAISKANILLAQAALKNKGYSSLKGRKMPPMPAEKKEKIRQSLLGKKHTPERSQKRTDYYLTHTHHGKGVPRSEETRRKIGLANSNPSKETLEKMSKAQIGRTPNMLGKKHKPETIQKMKEAQRGDKNWNWKGGAAGENKMARNTMSFRNWRKEVYERDNYTCQKCKIRGGDLHPHHILNFAERKDLRFIVDNGITLCQTHHLEFHFIYGKENNSQEQILEYVNT